LALLAFKEFASDKQDVFLVCLSNKIDLAFTLLSAST